MAVARTFNSRGDYELIVPVAGQPLSSRHAGLLVLGGIDEQAQVRAGLTSRVAGSTEGPHPQELPAGIVLPVPARDGTQATLRLFPDPAPLVTQPTDLGQFAPASHRLLDFGNGVRVPMPFLARPLIQRSPAVIVTTHDLWALALAARTGLVVVSTFGDNLLEQAVALAAEVASGAPVIIAMYIGPPVSGPTARSAAAIAGLLANEVRIASWSGLDINVVPRSPVPATRPAKPGGLWGSRSLVATGPLNILHCEGLGAVASELVGRALSAGMRALVSRPLRGPSPLGPEPSSAANLFRTAAEIEALGARRGATTAMMGGAAVDALVGRQVRPRKDLDIVMAGGSPDALEELTEDLEARGFELIYRRARSQAVLRQGSLVVDLYRLIVSRDGAMHLATRRTFARLVAPDCFVQVSIDGALLRVIAPACLYQLKLAKASRLENLLIRSQWEHAAADRADLAALRARFMGKKSLVRGEAEFQELRILPFAIRPLPSFPRPWRS